MDPKIIAQKYRFDITGVYEIYETWSENLSLLWPSEVEGGNF